METTLTITCGQECAVCPVAKFPEGVRDAVHAMFGKYSISELHSAPNETLERWSGEELRVNKIEPKAEFQIGVATAIRNQFNGICQDPTNTREENI